MTRKLFFALLIFSGIMNVVSFLLMRIDKQCAKKRKKRIPERILFLADLLFGGIGGYIAMNAFRHKTKHKNFAIGYPIIFAVQVMILGFLAVKVFV